MGPPLSQACRSQIYHLAINENKTPAEVCSLIPTGVSLKYMKHLCAMLTDPELAAQYLMGHKISPGRPRTSENELAYILHLQKSHVTYTIPKLHAQ